MTNFKFGVRVLDIYSEPSSSEILSRLRICHSHNTGTEAIILKETELERILSSFSAKENLLLIRCDPALKEFNSLQLRLDENERGLELSGYKPYKYLLVENVVSFSILE